MSKKISCATTVIMKLNKATSEIDRVLNEILFTSQPGYIGLPTDVCYTSIPSSTLETPLQTPLKTGLLPSDAQTESEAMTEIHRLLEASSRNIVIVDGGATRS
jgi:pyruvate decarboxylase